MPVIHPDSIRREQIVANVQVWIPVPVDVLEPGGQSPVHRQLGQASAILVAEPLQVISPRENAAAIVKEQEIRFAVLKDVAAFRNLEPPRKMRFLR